MVIFQLTYLPCLLHNSVPFSGVVVCYSQSNEFMVYKVKYSFIVRLRISSRDVQEQWMPVSPHTWDHDIRRYPHFCNSQQYKDSQMSHNSWRELSQTLQKTQHVSFHFCMDDIFKSICGHMHLRSASVETMEEPSGRFTATTFLAFVMCSLTKIPQISRNRRPIRFLPQRILILFSLTVNREFWRQCNMQLEVSLDLLTGRWKSFENTNSGEILQAILKC